MKKSLVTIFYLLVLISCKTNISEIDKSDVTTDSLRESTEMVGKWTEKAVFPGGARYGAFGFSLNNKIYLGGGHQAFQLGNDSKDNILKDFWQYDPTTNVWTQRANLPFSGILYGVSFTINEKGYLTAGIVDEASSNVFTYSNSLWEYNPKLDEWTQKKSFPGISRVYAVGFSHDQKGYVGLGNSADAGTFYNDLWQYNVEEDSWSQKQSLTIAGEKYALSLSTSQYGYIILSNNGAAVNACWRYDFNKDGWSKVEGLNAYAPEDARFTGTGFVLNDRIYYKPFYKRSNEPLASYSSDFWSYNAHTNQWQKAIDTRGFNLPNKIGFAVKNKGYLVLGHNFSARSLQTTTSLWEYSLE